MLTPEKFLDEAREFLKTKWAKERLVLANKEHLTSFLKIVEKKLDADTRSQTGR